MHRPRDPRRRVSLPAKVLCGRRADAARVHDVSRRGMMISCPQPPARNAFVEIMTSDAVFVARVVWVRDHRFGVRTRELVVLSPAGTLSALERERLQGAVASRRRASVDASSLARIGQFGSVIAVGAAIATAAAMLAASILGQAADEIGRHLG